MTSLVLDSTPSPPALAVAIGAVASGRPEGALCWSTVVQDILAVRGGTWQQPGSGGASSGAIIASAAGSWTATNNFTGGGGGSYIANAFTLVNGATVAAQDATITLLGRRQVRIDIEMSLGTSVANIFWYPGVRVDGSSELWLPYQYTPPVATGPWMAKYSIHTVLSAGTHTFQPGVAYFNGTTGQITTSNGYPLSLYIIDADPTSNGPLAQANLDGGNASTKYGGVPVINGGTA